MALYVWLSLAVSVVVAGAAVLFAVARGLAAWHTFRRFRRRAFESLGDVTAKVAGIESRLGKAGRSAERLEQARAELDDSLATARVLSAAFAEVRTTISRVTGLVPAK